MKMINKEINSDGTTTISVAYEKTHWLFFKKVVVKKYKATRRLVAEYWVWVELPDYTRVGDRLSFQLDEWNRMK